MKSEKPASSPKTPRPAQPRAARAKQVPQESAVRASSPAAGRRSAAAAGETQDRPSHDAIAERAYAFYQSRNWEHGRDLDDWLRAESELIAAGRAAAAPPRGRRRRSPPA
jgi:hypothetical protein